MYDWVGFVGCVDVGDWFVYCVGWYCDWCGVGVLLLDVVDGVVCLIGGVLIEVWIFFYNCGFWGF